MNEMTASKSKEMLLSASEARRLFSYDKETGVLTRKVKVSQRTKVGDPAGSIHKHRTKTYLTVCVNYSDYLCHRVIWLIVTGDWPEHEVDHEDGNGLNNRWSNLQCVTNAQNRKNTRRQSNNTSGQTGVHWCENEKKWIARISVDRKRYLLGLFEELDDAIAARKKAEKDYGYHKNHGSDRPL